MVNKMTKYYNKKIPIEISVVYGGRHYGKTYREFEKIKKRIEELEKENKRLKFAMQDTYDSANDTCGELQQRIKELEEELYELKGDYSIVVTGYKKLQQRLNKAIEFINSTCCLLASGNYIDLDKNDVVYLIKILKGESNDSK